MTYDIHLPAPYVYDDGSMRKTRILSYGKNESISLEEEDGNAFILLANPGHAREVARLLMIAADLVEKRETKS